MSKSAAAKQNTACTCDADLLKALKGLMAASGHMSPFGNDPSVMNIRRAGKYMAAFDAATAAIARVEARPLPR